MKRYARQMALAEVGHEGQAKIQAGHVVVVGAGGLGCPALQYLAGAGVGHLTIVDDDQVEVSNLHRQPLYHSGCLGQAKAKAARAQLTALNPGLSSSAVSSALTPATVSEIVAGADVVLDSADSFAVSYILSDFCRGTETPLISASALAFAGYVGGFCGGAPSLRAVFPDLPARAGTCASQGVLGSVVGMLGAMQAQMALACLIGLDPSPLGQMITVDLKDYRFGGFSFHGAHEPERSVPFLARSEIRPDDYVIELRDTEEAPTPVCASAHRATAEQLDCIDPSPGARVVVCCKSGLRAWNAAQALRQRGLHNLALVALDAA